MRHSAPGEGPGRRRSAPLAVAILIVLLLAVLLLAHGAPATRATAAGSPTDAGSPAAPGSPTTAETVADCLARGEVWLLVQTDDDRRLRSECVGAPASGMAALEAADVARTAAKGGYLCTLAGYPDRCPSRFDGRYWSYWHASGLDAEWVHAVTGPTDRRPAPGSVEGWCYVPEGERECTPPALTPAETTAPRVDLEPERTGLGAVPISIALAVLALAAGWVWWRRRTPIP